MFNVSPPKHFIRNLTFLAVAGCILMAIIVILITHMHLIYALVMFGMSIVVGSITGLILSWLYSKLLFSQESNTNVKNISKKIETIFENKIQVDFELNIKDILAYKIFSYDHYIPIIKSRRIMRRVTLLAFLVEILIAVILYLVYNPTQLLLVIIIILIAIFTFLWGLFSPWIIKRATIRAILGGYDKSLNGLIGKHTLAITYEAITDRSDFGELTIRWQAIDQLESAEQYVFIYPQTAIPLIIPKKAFADDASFRNFFETAKAFQQKTLS
jgi:hypothetical protein